MWWYENINIGLGDLFEQSGKGMNGRNVLILISIGLENWNAQSHVMGIETLTKGSMSYVGGIAIGKSRGWKLGHV